jgi:hypothetical protein
MTLLIRQSLHQAITERNAKILYRGTGVESYNDPHTMGLEEVAPLLPDAGSQWTLRWSLGAPKRVAPRDDAPVRPHS